ncbi:MAG: VOC family protein [Myxococcales bacterium]
MSPKRRAGFAPVLLAAALLGAAPGPALAPGPGTAAVEAVGPIALTVADADRSADFFVRALTFQKVSAVELAGPEIERVQGVFGVRVKVVTLRLGREEVELHQYLAPRGRPIPSDSAANDLWFQHLAIVVRDMDEAYQHLRRQNVGFVSTEPQRLPEWNPQAGGIRAFYFRDPDGHTLELIQFPAGKGEPRWQRPAGRQLFLGIDHTAIAVSDTASSLALYRDVLGMRVAGGSENYGTEQEHLSGVFGARVRITSLRAPAGPGIELLEYLAPHGGRAMPEGSRASDLWHWQTRLYVRDTHAAAARLEQAGVPFVSPGVQRAPVGLAFDSSLLVLDPDGHALQVVERGHGMQSRRQPSSSPR